MNTERKEISIKDWRKEIESRGDLNKIKFKCPVCGNDQSIEDFKQLGIDNDTIEGQFYFSCIGRHTGAKSMNEKPCNYTSGGLFCFNSLFIINDNKKIPVFDFSKNPLCVSK